MRQLFTFFFLLFLNAGLLLSANAEDTGFRAPQEVKGTKTVSAAEVKQHHEAGGVIVDVRNPRLYARRHIPGALHLNFSNSYNEKALSEVVKKDQPVVIYCSGVKCSRSYRASAMAVDWGYEKVLYFRGGIVEWRDAGYPVESSQ